MSIQVFSPVYEIEECLSEIRECLEKNWTGMGFKTLQFEDKWKAYTGFPNAHFLNSATAGLYLAVEMFKNEFSWDSDSEILTTALTFISTSHSILYNNLKPVFVDVDEYLCMDPVDLEKKITDKTKAVLYVGYAGNIGQLNLVYNLCKKYNLKLILDFAHCAGTRYCGEFPGKEADVVVYSFQAVKPLPTSDSGMICFKENYHDSIVRKLSWLGINKDTYQRSNEGNYKWKYDVEYLGNKYHGNSIIAAIGIAQLKYLDRDNQLRRNIAYRYNKNFESYRDKIHVLPITPNCETSQHLYVIQIDNRDGLIEYLNKEGINVSVHYIPSYEFKMYSHLKGTCPNLDSVSKRIVTLPVHLKLSNSDIDFISNKVIEYVK